MEWIYSSNTWAWKLKTTGGNEINFKRQIKANYSQVKAHEMHCFNKTRVHCTFCIGRLYEDLLAISLKQIPIDWTHLKVMRLTEQKPSIPKDTCGEWAYFYTNYIVVIICWTLFCGLHLFTMHYARCIEFWHSDMHIANCNKIKKKTWTFMLWVLENNFINLLTIVIFYFKVVL